MSLSHQINVNEAKRLILEKYNSATLEAALLCASYYGDQQDIHQILAYDVDINSKFGSESRTALHFACIAENIPIYHLLIALGANPDLEDKYGKKPSEYYSKVHLSEEGLADVVTGLNSLIPETCQLVLDYLPWKDTFNFPRISRSQAATFFKTECHEKSRLLKIFFEDNSIDNSPSVS